MPFVSLDNHALADPFSHEMRRVLQVREENVPLLAPVGEPTTVEEVTAAIKNLDGSADPGFDAISSAHLKCLPSRGIEALVEGFNAMLATGVSPEHFHRAPISVIPKPGKVQGTIENSRPITVLSATWRLLGYILQKRITDVFHAHKLVDESIFGNLKGKSSSQMAARAAAMIENATRAGSTEPLFCMLSDYSKCFDTIQFSAVEAALRSLGMPPLVVRLIVHMQQHQQRWITAKGVPHTSPEYTLAAGIAQGDALSPIILVCLTDVMLRFIKCSCATASRGIVTQVDDSGGVLEITFAGFETHSAKSGVVMVGPRADSGRAYKVGDEVQWMYPHKCECDPYVVRDAPCTGHAECSACTFASSADGRPECAHDVGRSCSVECGVRIPFHCYVDDADWAAASWRGCQIRSERHAAISTFFGLQINHLKTRTLCSDPTQVRRMRIGLPKVLWHDDRTPRGWLYEPLAPGPGAQAPSAAHVLLGNALSMFVKAVGRSEEQKTLTTGKRSAEEWLNSLWVSPAVDAHAIQRWVAVSAKVGKVKKLYYGFASVVEEASAAPSAQAARVARGAVVCAITFNADSGCPPALARIMRSISIAKLQKHAVHAAYPRDARKYDAAFSEARKTLHGRVARVQRHSLSIAQLMEICRTSVVPQVAFKLACVGGEGLEKRLTKLDDTLYALLAHGLGMGRYDISNEDTPLFRMLVRRKFDALGLKMPSIAASVRSSQLSNLMANLNEHGTQLQRLLLAQLRWARRGGANPQLQMCGADAFLLNGAPKLEIEPNFLRRPRSDGRRGADDAGECTLSRYYAGVMSARTLFGAADDEEISAISVFSDGSLFAPPRVEGKSEAELTHRMGWGADIEATLCRRGAKCVAPALPGDGAGTPAPVHTFAEMSRWRAAWWAEHLQSNPKLISTADATRRALTTEAWKNYVASLPTSGPDPAPADAVHDASRDGRDAASKVAVPGAAPNGASAAGQGTALSPGNGTGLRTVRARASGRIRNVDGACTLKSSARPEVQGIIEALVLTPAHVPLTVMLDNFGVLQRVAKCVHETARGQIRSTNRTAYNHVRYLLGLRRERRIQLGIVDPPFDERVHEGDAEARARYHAWYVEHGALETAGAPTFPRVCLWGLTIGWIPASHDNGVTDKGAARNDRADADARDAASTAPGAALSRLLVRVGPSGQVEAQFGGEILPGEADSFHNPIVTRHDDAYMLSPRPTPIVLRGVGTTGAAAEDDAGENPPKESQCTCRLLPTTEWCRPCDEMRRVFMTLELHASTENAEAAATLAEVQWVAGARGGGRA